MHWLLLQTLLTLGAAAHAAGTAPSPANTGTTEPNVAVAALESNSPSSEAGEQTFEALPTPEALIGVPNFISNFFSGGATQPPPLPERRDYRRRLSNIENARNRLHAQESGASDRRYPNRVPKKQFRKPVRSIDFYSPGEEALIEDFDHVYETASLSEVNDDPIYESDTYDADFDTQYSYRNKRKLLPYSDSSISYVISEDGNPRRTRHKNPKFNRHNRRQYETNERLISNSVEARNPNHRYPNEESSFFENLIGSVSSLNPISFFTLGTTPVQPEKSEPIMRRQTNGNYPTNPRYREDFLNKKTTIDGYRDIHPRHRFSQSESMSVERPRGQRNRPLHENDVDVVIGRNHRRTKPLTQHSKPYRREPSHSDRHPHDSHPHDSHPTKPAHDSEFRPISPRGLNDRSYRAHDHRLAAVRDAIRTNKRSNANRATFHPADDSHDSFDPNPEVSDPLLVPSSEIRYEVTRSREDPRLAGAKFKKDSPLRDDLYVGADGNIYIKDSVTASIAGFSSERSRPEQHIDESNDSSQMHYMDDSSSRRVSDSRSRHKEPRDNFGGGRTRSRNRINYRNRQRPNRRQGGSESNIYEIFHSINRNTNNRQDMNAFSKRELLSTELHDPVEIRKTSAHKRPTIIQSHEPPTANLWSNKPSPTNLWSDPVIPERKSSGDASTDFSYAANFAERRA